MTTENVGGASLPSEPTLGRGGASPLQAKGENGSIRSDPAYDYGPPVEVGTDPDHVGVPQDNAEAVVVEEEGESPLAPPPDAGTTPEEGGSPTDESGSSSLSVVATVDSQDPMMWHFDAGTNDMTGFDFGDGTTHTTSDGQGVHTYSAAGDYTVRAVAGVREGSTSITVTAPAGG